MPSIKIIESFLCDVEIITPGKCENLNVEFKFTNKYGDNLHEFHDFAKNVESDFLLLKEIVIGWNLDEEYNDENLEKLIKYYPKSPSCIFKKFMEEISEAIIKN